MTRVPSIETERLRLREFEPRDADATRFFSDPDVMRFIPGGARDPALHETRFAALLTKGREHWELHGYGLWALELKQSGAVIGHAGLQRLPDADEIEVYYLLDKPYWGRGLAAEAAKAVLAYGFTTGGLDRIVAIAMPDNGASLRVMEKAGMRRVGPAHHYGIDCIKYELTRAGAAGGEKHPSLEPHPHG